MEQSKRWTISDNINVIQLDGKIIFTSSGNKIISLLKHIRNAYAHNLVVLDDKYVIIGDFLTKNNKPIFNQPTMLGRITLENFEELIKSIKSLANENN